VDAADAADQVWAVVVAAGSGSRYGGSKQYERLHGRTVLEWSVAAARSVCAGVVVVLPPADVSQWVPDGSVAVAGGTTRSASVRAGLTAVPADAEVIVVHDAARPLAGRALWNAAVAAVRAGADGAICAVPVTDTVKRVDGAVVVETIDRAELVSVQTPQAFRAAALRAAHADGDDASDDAALVERAGGRVVIVPGSPDNLKITHAHDLAVAAALAPLVAP
jgi:2-C-methyl-D-erythritol 4-phosphate cytidylyltransferase